MRNAIADPKAEKPPARNHEVPFKRHFGADIPLDALGFPPGHWRDTQNSQSCSASQGGKLVPLQLRILGGVLDVVANGVGSVFVTIRYEQFELTARGDDMAYTLPIDKQVKVQVKYVDAGGNPAVVDGDVTWDSSNPQVAQVLADRDDSTIAQVIPQGLVGQVQIIATADADLGAGVRELITTMDVTVVAGEAVAGTIEPMGPHVEPATPEPRR